ncbi:hypothetical protein MUP77_15025, partial [Candidatus Bathyarchaeota archaeon]|nr:hypothetical protein [Candidatus Bathyarchaeota archaeon]
FRHDKGIVQEDKALVAVESLFGCSQFLFLGDDVAVPVLGLSRLLFSIVSIGLSSFFSISTGGRFEDTFFSFSIFYSSVYICIEHSYNLLLVCGGAWVNMRKTIRPSFFYEKAQRAFDSLPFS